MITTLQCSIIMYICKLNNKPRIVVRYFELLNTCSIWLHSLSGGYYIEAYFATHANSAQAE